MIIQIAFIILNVTLVKSQITTLRPPQISTLYSTSYSYVISSMIVSIPAGNQTSSSSSKNETINNGPIIPKKVVVDYQPELFVPLLFQQLLPF